MSRSKPEAADPFPLALLATHAGELSTGPLQALPEVIVQLGGNPARIFAAAEVDLDRYLAGGAQSLDYAAVARLLSAAVQQTRCDHFGLLLGRRFRLEDLGPVGHLMRFAATAQNALQDLVTSAQLHDRGATPLLLPFSGQFNLLGYVVHRHDLAHPSPVLDAAVMIGFQILRELLGPRWTPARVQLAYRQPADTTPYSRAFCCPVQFDAPISGLVINSQQLDRKQSSSSPRLHGLLRRAIADTTASLPISEQVKRLLYALILEGQACTEQVAMRLALHERTLRRRLDSEGTSLQQLIAESRRDLAFQLLRHTRLPVFAIAQALQYRDPNAFSRAFRSWSGSSPLGWRAAIAMQGDEGLHRADEANPLVEVELG